MNATFKVNDWAGISDPRWAGRVFKVIKVNPTTYVLEPKERAYPSERNIKIPREMAIAATEHGIAEDMQQGQTWVYRSPGTLVRYLGCKPIAGLIHGGLGVVLADKGQRVNVAKLGGNGDQYARIPPAMLETVDPAEVLR